MSGLNNDINANVDNEGKMSIGDKLKKIWNEYKIWCIILGIAVVVFIIALIIVFVVLKKESFGTKKKKNEMEAKKNDSKEGFVTVNDITENSYVNSYIESTRGEWEEEV